MKPLEKIRNFAYQSIDFLKGAKVAKHYHEIKYITKNYNSKKAKLLREYILNHTVNTTPFYYENLNFKIFRLLIKI